MNNISYKTVHDIQGYSYDQEHGLGRLGFGEFPGWWAGTVATYCPSRLVQHPETKSTKPMNLTV